MTISLSGRLKELDHILGFDGDMRYVAAQLDTAVNPLNQVHGGDMGVDPSSVRASLTAIQYALSKNYTDYGNELCCMELILFVVSVFNEMPRGRIPGSDNLWTRIRMMPLQGSSCPTATKVLTCLLTCDYGSCCESQRRWWEQ